MPTIPFPFLTPPTPQYFEAIQLSQPRPACALIYILEYFKIAKFSQPLAKYKQTFPLEKVRLAL